jgi:D-glycero-alpha-D-manno-heptose-7-phosphate kinase
VIVVRIPTRITLGGGGSDDPRYAKKHGGFAITAAIDKYIYVGVNKTFTKGYLCRYSDTEHADNLANIAHPIIRESLRFYDVPTGVEIVSVADIPSGTGLGSSGAFTVGLCMALSAYMGMNLSQAQAATHAAHIELDVLDRPGGQQDHWATALGGVRALKFAKTGYVFGSMVDAPVPALNALEDSLHLYYTGTRRDAHEILSTQTTDGLDDIKHLGLQVHQRIVAGDITGLGKLMNKHWFLKRQRSSQMTNTEIDLAYAVALDNGAIGGKLVGAGGGGFILCVTEDADKLTPAMAAIGMPEVPFKFDHVGATLISIL